MTPKLEDFRTKYPQYNDLTDEQLVTGLHKKHYSDMPFEEFSAKLGYKQAPTAPAGVSTTGENYSLEGRNNPTPVVESFPTGIAPSKMGQQFKSGVRQMQASHFASAGRNRAADLNVMDRIDRGETVPETEDVTGYQHMSPEERNAIRGTMGGALTQNVQQFQKFNKKSQAYESNPRMKQFGELANKGDYKGAWEVFKKDPLGIVQQASVQSLPNAIPSAVVGGGAALILKGGIPALMAGLATGSYPIEFMNSIVESLQNSGVDLNDSVAVEARLRNPKFIEDAGKRATTRGTVIAAADAAGGALVPGLKPGVSAARNVGRAGAAILGETGLEMAGEAGAQAASGEDFKVGDIALEGMGALPSAVGISGVKTVMEARNTPERVFSRELDRAVQNYGGIPESNLTQKSVEMNLGMPSAVRDEPFVGPIPPMTSDIYGPPESAMMSAQTPPEGVETQTKVTKPEIKSTTWQVKGKDNTTDVAFEARVRAAVEAAKLSPTVSNHNGLMTPESLAVFQPTDPVKLEEARNQLREQRSANPFEDAKQDESYLEALGSTEKPMPEQPGYLESLGSTERPTAAPRDVDADYLDSFGSTEPPGATTYEDSQPEGAGETAFADSNREMAERPSKAVPLSEEPKAAPKKRKEKTPEQKAAANKAARERRARAKAIKDEQKLGGGPETTSGAAVSQVYYKFEDDIEAIDRVWAKTGEIFMPWYKTDQMYDPYKIAYNSVFQFQPDAAIANQWDPTDPKGVTKMLLAFVPWLMDEGLPNTWGDFTRLYGNQFEAHGYDAFAFRDYDTPYLIPFVQGQVTAITQPTARNLEAQKYSEHYKQLRAALWTRFDQKGTKDPQGLLVDLKKRIEEGVDAKGILTILSTQGPSQSIRSLSKSLANAIEAQEQALLFTTLELKSVPENGANYGGYYNIEEGTGKVTLFVENAGMTYRVLIHELIHAVTIPPLALMSEYMKDNDNFRADGTPINPELVQRYKDLKKKSAEFYAYVQRNLAALDLSKEVEYNNKLIQKLMYNQSAWTENVHEVLAYALTDVDFQKILHAIPVKEGNGLFKTTEAVREFHGIEEDMNTLFFEAVKLFNEFAQFQYHLIGSEVPTYAALVRAPAYRAQITGPPSIDAGIMTFVNHYSELQIMNAGSLPRMFEAGGVRLQQATTQNGAKIADIFPLVDGTAVDNFMTTGQPPVGQMAPAPLYVIGIPKVHFDKMKSFRKGIVFQGVHYFAVSNMQLGSFNEAMRQKYPDSFMTYDEAMFLLERGVSITEAIKPWADAYEARTKYSTLPQAVQASLPKNLRDALTKQRRYMDPPTVAEAIALFMKNPKDIATTVWNQVVSGAESYATHTDNPLIAFARGRISKAIAEQSQISKEVITPLGEVFQKMKKVERQQITKILVDGDRNEVEFDEPTLRSLGMNDRQILYYQLIRKAADYDYQLWNEKRTRIGMPPVPYRTGYLPSIFDGDFKSIVRVRTVDANGKTQDEVVGVVTANYGAAFEKRKNVVREKLKGKTVLFEDVDKRSFVGAPVPGQLFDLYGTLVKQLGPTDPEIAKMQDMLQEFAKFDEGRYLGFHVHELAKKGVWGASGDKFWLNADKNAEELFTEVIRFLEEGSAHHNSLVFMQEMDQIFLNPDLQLQAPKTLMYLRELYNHVLRHDPKVGAKYSKLAKVFKGVGRVGDGTVQIMLDASDMSKYTSIGPKTVHEVTGGMRYLFATFAMGMYNMMFAMLQVAQLAFNAPQMAMATRKELGLSFTEGRLAGAKAAMTTIHYIIHHALGDMPVFGKKAQKGFEMLFGPYAKNSDTEMAMKYAEDNNLINFTDIERAVEKTLNPKLAYADRILNANQRYSEALTRPMAFLWFYNLERAAGIPQREALEIARHKTQFVMVPYDIRDRPMMYAAMGLFGNMLGQLKTFMHSDIGQKFFWIKGAVTRKQFAPVIYTAMISLLAQGQMGTMGVQDVDNLVRATNNWWFGKNEGIKEVLAKNVPIAVERGLLSEWSNIDFHARLRSPPVFQSPLLMTLVPPSVTFTIGLAKSVGNLVEDAFTADSYETYMESPDTQRGILGLTPPAAKGIVEKRFSEDGNLMKYSEGSAPLKAYKRTERDWILRYLGTRSHDEALALEKQYDSAGDMIARNERKKAAAKALREAYATKTYSPEAMKKLRKDYFDAGGTVKEYKMILMGQWQPDTVEQRMIGKPSMNRAEEIIKRLEILKGREREQ